VGVLGPSNRVEAADKALVAELDWLIELMLGHHWDRLPTNPPSIHSRHGMVSTYRLRCAPLLLARCFRPDSADEATIGLKGSTVSDAAPVPIQHPSTTSGPSQDLHDLTLLHTEG